jgi:hypothetical protein
VRSSQALRECLVRAPSDRCRDSYADADGVVHSVEVDADSLYEAVALAVAEFRQGEIITDVPRPMTEFCVTVMRKPIEHRIYFKKIQQWVQPTTKDGPAGCVFRAMAITVPG